MNKTIFSILFFIAFSYTGFSQSLDSLTVLIKEIQRGKTDSVRQQSNEKFILLFKNILQKEGSFNRNFDSLKNISILMPEDKKFRMYTWVLPHYDGSEYEYFGFIQLHSEKSDTLIQLIDSTKSIIKPESEKLTSQRWLGSVYYSIVPITKSDKTYYTLLGWKAKDQSTTQKIIEIVYLNGNQVKFGFPILKTNSVFHNRMIYSFNSQATMTLHFDKNFGGIVFDHVTANKKDESLSTGPDGTYDAFKILKGRWVLMQDIDVRTKWQPSDKLPDEPVEKQ